MDPRHRDRMAFLRVCSGRFEKDMEVFNPRLGRTVRLTRPHRLFGQDRETVEEAFPGDVVGLVNPGLFAIGDTLCAGEPIQYTPVPRFPPECFARIENRSTGRHKQFHAGLAQLEEEGAIQALLDRRRPRTDPGRGRRSPARRHRRPPAGRVRRRGRCQPAPLRNRPLGGRRRRRRQRAQLADARRAAHRGPRRPPGGPLRLRLGPCRYTEEKNPGWCSGRWGEVPHPWQPFLPWSGARRVILRNLGPHRPVRGTRFFACSQNDTNSTDALASLERGKGSTGEAGVAPTCRLTDPPHSPSSSANWNSEQPPSTRRTLPVM